AVPLMGLPLASVRVPVICTLVEYNGIGNNNSNSNSNLFIVRLLGLSLTGTVHNVLLLGREQGLRLRALRQGSVVPCWYSIGKRSASGSGWLGTRAGGSRWPHLPGIVSAALGSPASG